MTTYLPGGSGDKSSYSGRNFPFVWRHALVVVTSFLVVILCLVVLSSAYSYHYLPRSYFYGFSASPRNELDIVLKKASMADKTVIITTINGAWAEPNSLMDMFLESFRIGNRTRRFLNHLVVVALDQKAYTRCLARHSHCYALKGTDGDNLSTGEAYFMTPDYLKLMWRRIEFLTSVLEKGYNFVFTDADIVWFRDPFSRFYSDADFQTACDYYLGNSSSLKNFPNGGFNYVKSNCRTVEFYKFWYSSRETYPGLHDQDVFNKIKFEPYISKLGLRIKFLDTAYFGGFCQPSKNLDQVCTMHANCCYGLQSKVHDLQVLLEDWKEYKSFSPRRNAPPWSAPQKCSLRDFHPPHGREKDQK